jgi:hypothetical protein
MLTTPAESREATYHSPTAATIQNASVSIAETGACQRNELARHTTTDSEGEAECENRYQNRILAVKEKHL